MVLSSLKNIDSETVQDAVKKHVVENVGTENVQIKVEPASQIGNTFTGNVYRVSYGPAAPTEQQKTESKMIVKVAPQNDYRREHFMSGPCFAREIHVFDEVLPKFRQFQGANGVVGEESGFYEYPAHYKIIKSASNECIMLEDLQAKNFTTANQLTDQHVRLVMQALGKFHAVSFAMKQKQPEDFKKLTANMNELLFHKDDQRREVYVNELAADALFLVANNTDLSNKMKASFQKGYFEVGMDCVNAANEPNTVICHGDCLSNNSLFKYNENDEVVDVRLIDWQMSRVASPVCDILYYIFCCTEKQLRDKHYDGWLAAYHDSLTQQLSKLGLEAAEIFSFDNLRDHLRRYGKFAFVTAAVVIPMLISEQGHIPDLNKFAEGISNGSIVPDRNLYLSDKTRNIYNKRLEDVIIDMARLEYI